MRKTIIDRLTLAGMLICITLLVIGLVGTCIYDTTLLYILPRCTEDAVLIGYGEFDDGRWTDYECGPAVDDYK